MRFVLKFFMLLILISGFYVQSLHTMLATILWIASIILVVAVFSDTTISELAGRFRASSSTDKAASAVYSIAMIGGMAAAGYPILAGVMFFQTALVYGMIRRHLAMEG